MFQCLNLGSTDDDDDDDDDGLYFKTMCIKAAKACGVVYNNWSLSKLTRSMYRKNVEPKLAVLVDINMSIN